MSALLEKHLLVDENGVVVFVFDKETSISVDDKGEITFVTDKDVLDFSSLMAEMGLPEVQEAAEALVQALLEQRESGQMQDFA